MPILSPLTSRTPLPPPLSPPSIPVISDLPGVGSNLQDHPAAVVSYETPKKGVSVTSKLRISGTKLNNPLPLLKWFARGKGELTSVGCDHGAFVNTEGNEGGQPDLQVRFLPARALGPDGMTTFTQVRRGRAREARRGNEEGEEGEEDGEDEEDEDEERKEDRKEELRKEELRKEELS